MSKQCQPNSKDKYKILNWKEYNESLRQRGSINIWISQEALSSWNYEGPKLKGGQKKYSDLAIETCLTIRKLFNLKLRQTEGFIKSLFTLLNVSLDIPDFSTLSRRGKSLKISLGTFKKDEKVDIIIDSTGLKVYGEGEWKVRKFGWSKHRTWRKLHICIDGNTQEIIEEELTENSIDDGDVAEKILENAPEKINSFTGDGAYDKKKVRKKLTKENIIEIIPPQHNAVISKELSPSTKSRDEAVEEIQKIGREQWKKEVGYHKRSLVEVAMFRYKTIIGDKIMSRKFENEKVEVRIGCAILNKMTALGMPKSIKIA
jgi:hypothetical protein